MSGSAEPFKKRFWTTGLCVSRLASNLSFEGRVRLEMFGELERLDCSQIVYCYCGVRGTIKVSLAKSWSGICGVSLPPELDWLEALLCF